MDEFYYFSRTCMVKDEKYFDRFDKAFGLHFKDLEALEKKIRDAGGEAIANGADVADWEQTGALVKQAIDAFGGLDVVVNNAGFLRDRMFASSTEEDWDAIMRVHLKGHYCVSRHACQYWRDQSKAKKAVDARIINTSSGAGLQGSVGQHNYSAAKGGIATLTLVQAAELGRYGITANAIAPAARTRMTEAIFADMKPPEDGTFDANAAENISPLVVWLGSSESKDVTGCIFEVKGGVIGLSEGWRDGHMIDKGTRWEPDEVGATVREVIEKSRNPQKVWGT